MIKTMAIIFRTKPVSTMSLKRMWPLAKTMALGGVAMGIMPAQLAASVMGMPSNTGLRCRLSAMADTSGAKTMT